MRTAHSGLGALSLSFTLFSFLPEEPEKKADDTAGNPEAATRRQ